MKLTGKMLVQGATTLREVELTEREQTKATLDSCFETLADNPNAAAAALVLLSHVIYDQSDCLTNDDMRTNYRMIAPKLERLARSATIKHWAHPLAYI